MTLELGGTEEIIPLSLVYFKKFCHGQTYIFLHISYVLPGSSPSVALPCLLKPPQAALQFSHLVPLINMQHLFHLLPPRRLPGLAARGSRNHGLLERVRHCPPLANAWIVPQPNGGVDVLVLFDTFGFKLDDLGNTSPMVPAAT